jgi:SulP family sulfate permease
VPAPLLALAAGALVAWLLERFAPGADVVTLAERFGSPEHPAGIPRVPPLPVLPWALAGPGGASGAPLSLDLVRSLLPSAFAIAMLGAIESLLSAVVSDGMTGRKHDPDVELLALGIGNLASPFFGGIPATGAIARTATNVRSGARSPIAAVVHALFVLAAVLVLAPVLGALPMASLAALLLMVAWNMSEVRHFARVVRIAPRSDTAVLLTCFALTVLFDMTLAVSVGIVLAAVLFMRRMVEISGARLIGEHHPASDEPLPPGLVVFEIAGPLFFGAAHKATSQLTSVDRARTKVVVLDLAAVPALDATGLFNLQSAVDRLQSFGIAVLLAGLQPQPARALAKAGLIGGASPRVDAHPRLREALADARQRLAS